MNPILPGFNPDPSVVLVDGAYYLVTSTFEYLPGMPVYRSEDRPSLSPAGCRVCTPWTEQSHSQT